MRKAHVIGLGLVVALALGALSASPALAVSKYLLNGAEILTEIEGQEEGEMSFVDMKGLGETQILFSRIADYRGWFPFRLLHQWLMLDGKPLLSNGVEGEPGVLGDVEVHGGICTEATVAVRGIPWKVEVGLSGSTYEDLVTAGEAGSGEPGITIDCLVLGILMEDVCTGPTAMVLTNNESGVTAEYSENETLTPPWNCSIGGAGQGLLKGAELVLASSGTLSVSE